MDLEKTKNISKTYKFSIFKSLYTQNRKFENLGNFSFTSNVGSCCDSRIKNDIKNELRQKLAGWYIDLEEKNKISEVSEFSILPYTQRSKLRNLPKFSFTSNFDPFDCIKREKI